MQVHLMSDRCAAPSVSGPPSLTLSASQRSYGESSGFQVHVATEECRGQGLMGFVCKYWRCSCSIWDCVQLPTKRRLLFCSLGICETRVSILWLGLARTLELCAGSFRCGRFDDDINDGCDADGRCSSEDEVRFRELVMVVERPEA